MSASEKLDAKELSLEFLPNDAEEEEGLGNAGIETYRDEPYAGGAREVAQNSRDAAAELPVRISFDLLEIPTSDVPSIDRLRTAVGACLDKAKLAGDDKGIGFFTQARNVLGNGTLKVLRISDSNTTGARGPSKTGTPFHSLLKGAGVSKKDSDTAGGSFGIGKNAVYAISDLQTVFYSTVYLDELTGTKRFLAQGKSVLVSHTDEADKPRRATGYWGLSKFHPVENPEMVPEWMWRDDPGLSVFVLGFRHTPDWQRRIAYSLVQNFFCAVHDGEMEFAIDHGGIKIGRLNLDPLFQDADLRKVAEQNDRAQEFDLSRNLYRCLVSPESKEDVVEIGGLGRIRIRVLVNDGLPKRVSIIRNGMVITDSLEHFGEKFARFPMYRDFVSLVVPLDDEGRALIKRLENPKHDGLSAERLPDEAKRNQAKSVMRRLARTIRDTIKSYTLAKFESEVSVDELAQYFATDVNRNPANGDSAAEDPQTIKYRIEPRKPKNGTRAARAGRRGGTGPGPRTAKGAGGETARPRMPSGRTSAQPIVLDDVRNVMGVAGPRSRRIFLTSPEGGTARIVIEAPGLSESESLMVTHASNSTVTNGIISTHLKANERVELDVEFAEAYRGPLDLQVVIEPEGEPANEDQ